MKATGIVRRIDELGRIVIPKEIRRQCNLGENETVAIELKNDKTVYIGKHDENIYTQTVVIDDLGRALIPKSMRSFLNIREGDPLEFYVDFGRVVIKSYISSDERKIEKEEKVNPDTQVFRFKFNIVGRQVLLRGLMRALTNAIGDGKWSDTKALIAGQYNLEWETVTTLTNRQMILILGGIDDYVCDTASLYDDETIEEQNYDKDFLTYIKEIREATKMIMDVLDRPEIYCIKEEI
jgi:AbrB family looped-hinge helix DNA binding protein